MPSDFVKDIVATDPLVKDNHKCVKIVMSAITKQFKEMRLGERGSRLIGVGGLVNPCKVIEFCNFSGSAKSVYPDLPSPACYSKCLKLNGYIYSIGGRLKFEITKDIEITNKVHRMNINDSEMKWEEVCPLNEGRCVMGAAAVFKDCLVVAGGGNEKSKASPRDAIYIPTLNKWQRMSKLNQDRMANELVSCNGCLFALGGNDGKQYLSSMEKLNDLDGEWEVVEAMNEPRAWFAAVNCQEEIYAIGGGNKTSDGKDIALKSVEKYNPVEKKWTFVNSINIEREFHAACALRGKIFVVARQNTLSTQDPTVPL